MIRQTHRCRSPLLAAALVLAPALAGAQTVVDQVEVNVIELDVSVRDRKGRSVTGLTREDFTVSMSGVPIEISNFRATTQVASAPETAGDEAAVASQESRQLVLYFDETSLDSGERTALSKSLAASLEQGLAPGARVMVAGRQGFELAIYQPFTGRSELLATAVERALAAAPHNPTGASLSEFLREIERSLSAIEDRPRASAQARSRVLAARGSIFVSEAQQRVARAADVFEELVLTLGGVPGRSGLLYVGDGLAVNPGEVVAGALRDAFSRFGLRSVSDSIDSTSPASLGGGKLTAAADFAASRRVAVYALDTSARQTFAAATAEYRSIDAGRSGGAAPTDNWTPGVSSRRRLEIQSALLTVAEATGGRLFTDRRSDLVEVLLDDMGTYYSLGVEATPSLRSSANGEGSGSLEVTVRGRGMRAHHRRATRPRSADALDADRTVAALLGGAGDGTDLFGASTLGADTQGAGTLETNALGLTVTVGEIKPEDGGEGIWAVPLAVRVPVAALRVVAKDRRHEGQLSIFVATRDAAQQLSAVRKTVLPVGLANSALATAVGRDAEYRLELQLPAGPAQIAIAVRDDLDPVLSLLMLEIEVGSGMVTPPS